MKICLRFLSVGCLLISFSSCMRLLYGIKSPHAMQSEEISAKAIKWHIDTAHLYELNQQFLYQLYDWQERGQKTLAKHRHQPLQLIYFNPNGKMVSQHMNCYAQGFPNLRWQRDGRMNTFPPISATAPDSAFDLSMQLQLIRPLHTVPIPMKASNYTIAIYWNSFMGRQSRRLVRMATKNLKKAGNKPYQLLFINTDNYYAGKLY